MSKAKKILIGVVVLLVAVALVIACGIGSQNGEGTWFQNRNVLTWFNSWGKDKPVEEKKDNSLMAISSDGRKLLAGNSYAMPRAMAFVGKPSTYSAAKEFNVKATLSNKYINGQFDWAVEFDNPASAWATGKDVEDHVQVEPTSDGSATATVKYLAVFNEPVRLTATLRGSEQSDSCQIDCLKNAEMYECWLDVDDFGQVIEGGCTSRASMGTVFADYKVYYARLTLDDVFVEAVQNYLKFDVNIHDYDFTELFGDKILGVEASTDTLKQLYFRFSERTLTYSDFIDNFDGFDDEHKEAIYFAWYHAALDTSDLIKFELGLEAYVNGVATGIFDGYECVNKISGADYGADVQPSVTLNTNVIF